MTGTYLFLGLVFSSMGLGYFIYGKKQALFMPLICGVLLMVYPYFVPGILLMVLVGLLLMVLPFVFRV